MRRAANPAASRAPVPGSGILLFVFATVVKECVMSWNPEVAVSWTRADTVRLLVPVLFAWVMGLPENTKR